MKQRFDLDKNIAGMSAVDYMSDLIERNERGELELERCKASVSILKQINNRCRLLIDAAKYELKEREMVSEKTT